MSKSIFPTFALARNWLTHALLLTAAVGALAQPFQAPLLNRTGNSATPNLVLDLDESGSMAYQHMPEGAFTLADKSITLAGDSSLRMHPLDTRTYSGTYRGSWPANIGATGTELLYQQQVRSSDVNTLYYNPETTYLPWIKKNTGTGLYDGVTRFPAANLSTAYFDPMVSSGNIAYVNKGASVTASSNNLSVPMPAGYLVGDLLMCFGQSIDNVTHSTSTGGWTQIYNIKSGTNNSGSAFYRVASSTSHGNLTISHSAGNRILGRCHAFRGVNAGTPFDVSYVAAHGVSAAVDSTTINGGSMSTVTNGGLLLMASHISSGTTTLSTSSPGLTWTVADIQAASGTVALGLSYSNELPVPTTIASSSVKSIGNVSGKNTGVLISLRPAIAPTLANLGAATGSVTADWCLSSGGGCGSSALSYTPMLYYRLQKTGSTYKDPTINANYDRYDLTNATVKIGTAATTPLVSISSLPTRTDCTAGVCTLAQERQILPIGLYTTAHACWWRKARLQSLSGVLQRTNCVWAGAISIRDIPR